MVINDREQMIVENIGLVHSIANRFRGRGIEYDDLYQAGCVGLIKAVDNFDFSKGYAFSTYAVPVIMGDIKRLFRDGGAIKVSRSLKEKSIKVQGIRDRFQKEHLREPTISELSSLSNISVEELSEVLNILSPPISLSYTNDDEENVLEIPVDESDDVFNRLYVNSALKNLTYDDYMLIQYRFFQCKTQCQTAKLLNISQVQVSRREKKLLLMLRQHLE